MKSATRTTVSTFGTLIALAGLEHGLGEALQGNVAPGGPMILSWPGPGPFSAVGGEPAITLLPNLLVAGLLTMLASLAFLVWATLLVERQRAGLTLALLCVMMFLVGGGVFPPILGLIVAAVATKVNASLRWWRMHFSDRSRHLLGALWSWSFAACLVTWLLMLPGLVVLAYFFHVADPKLTLVLLIGMLGFFSLTIVAGFMRDIQERLSSPFTPWFAAFRPSAPTPAEAEIHYREIAS